MLLPLIFFKDVMITHYTGGQVAFLTILSTSLIHCANQDAQAAKFYHLVFDKLRLNLVVCGNLCDQPNFLLMHDPYVLPQAAHQPITISTHPDSKTYAYCPFDSRL